MKVEVTDMSEDTAENTGGEDGVQTSEENPESEDGASKINKEKTFWIQYDDFWKCFGCVDLYYRELLSHCS